MMKNYPLVRPNFRNLILFDLNHFHFKQMRSIVSEPLNDLGILVVWNDILYNLVVLNDFLKLISKRFNVSEHLNDSFPNNLLKLVLILVLMLL